MKTWWYEVVDEDSEWCGEEFFVEAETREEADEIATENFIGVGLRCHGVVTDEEAEFMGLDTY